MVRHSRTAEHETALDGFWGYAGLVGVAVSLWALALPSPVVAAGVIGNGTAESCTELALDEALAGGGVVTFECGAQPVTITLTTEKAVTAETSVDGGGLVTLSGGAVRVFHVHAALDVRNLTIANGRPTGGGGGILNDGGTVTVTNCTFSGNEARRGPGGGIYNSGTVTITDSTFVSNHAPAFVIPIPCGSFGCGRGSGPRGVRVPGLGGGIFNTGTATLTNCTLTGDSATNGGGIYNRGTLTLTNCTLNNNSATDGGGIYASSGTLTVSNTILANSDGENCYGSVIDGGHNVIGDAGGACGLANDVKGNIVGVDPLLDPDGLRDNGGPTQTIALLDGSPAIDAGDPEICANPPVNGIDQRGHVRPGVGRTTCSIGAFESDSPAPTPRPSATPTATGTATTTATGTSTRTPTITRTPRVTRTPTRTVRHTPTRTATRPAAPSRTPTRTKMPTETPTPACMPSACGTGFIDNCDGTIADCSTELMWEKKSDDGSLHDKDNTYRWAGRCYDGGNNWVGTYCQPDAAAATACAAGTRSASTVGCGQCGSRETCNLFGVPTIWQWLVAVNAEGGTGFAGHNDWQIPLQIPPVASQGTPTAFELDSLVNVGASGCGWGSPCAYSAFNTRCVGRCTVALCSCTQSGKYWSATTSVRGLTGAWDVLFDSGGREISNKYFPHYVRAVRGGP